MDAKQSSEAERLIREDQECMTGHDEEYSERDRAAMRLDGALTALRETERAAAEGMHAADQRSCLVLAAQLAAIATDDLLQAARTI